MFLFLGCAAVALFTFLAVAAYTDGRTKERVEYYKQETLKKLAEQPPEQARVVMEVFRQEERLKHRKGLEGIKLAGMIMTMIGIGLFVFLYMVVPEQGVAYLGMVPLGIGLAFLIYATLMAPKPEEMVPGGQDH
jgi:Flp pilus assembly protein TadB